MINLIVMILVGALAGYVGSLLMGTDRKMGAIANIVIGILGSMLGGLVYSLLTQGDADLTTAYLNFSVVGVVVSILGAVGLIAILKALNVGRFN